MGSSNVTLNRQLGMREGITITTGTVIGVGLFTTGANCVGIMGAGIILLTFIGLLICILPALMYAEMGAALPYAGGTYNYAKRAISLPVANISAWHYLMALIACCSTESLAFSNYFSWIFKGMGMEVAIDNRIIAAVLMFLFVFINYRGVKLSGRWQNAFVFFFWSVSAVWMLVMIHNIDFSNYLPETLTTFPGFKAWVEILTWIWWCYAGFETCVGMGGEIKYPQINIPRALFLAPFVIFIVNALFQWFLAGLVPAASHSALAEAAAPYAEGLQMAGYMGFPIVLLCIGVAFGGDFSTMNPGIEAPSRYIYQMGQDGCLPRVFGKLHPKFRTPYIAILTVGIISFLLILTNSIAFVAQINICSLFWCYIIGFISFWELRRKEPELKRPSKAPWPVVSTVSSSLRYALMMWSCGWVHVGISFIITACSLVVFYLFARKGSISQEEIKELQAKEAAMLEEDVPSAEEKSKMDKEYRIWKIAVSILTVLIILLYVVSFLLK